MPIRISSLKRRSHRVESEIETFWASDGRRREIGFDLSIEWRVMSNRPYYFTQQKKNSTMNSTNNNKEILNEFSFRNSLLFFQNLSHGLLDSISLDFHYKANCVHWGKWNFGPKTFSKNHIIWRIVLIKNPALLYFC